MVLAACARDPAAQPSKTPRNVLLVTIDSLRADHVRAYGDGEAQTPALDALAAGGVRFDHAYAAAPLTLPSHASLMTGRYPPRHGARTDAGHLDPAALTIAEAFRRAGFATAAFAAGPPLDRRSGLDRGFESYTVGGQDSHAETWLDAHRDRRCFVWLHLFDPHAPYGNPADRARVARPAIDRYDDDVAAADARLARLVRFLGPRLRDTLLAVTSDHGEAFGEHGEVTHGLFVYDTTLRVPLILNGPPLDGGRVATDPVSLVDVAPTIATLAGLGRFESDGENLPTSAPRAPTSSPRAVYAETYAPLSDYGWSPLRALRRGDWKYIEAPRPELYDLKSDPGETRNLVDDQPARAAELARALEAIAPAPAGADGGRQDPKDQREIAARLAEVTSGELRGPLLERALREIIRDDPGNGAANLRLAELLAASNRCKEAVKRLKLAVAAHAPGADDKILRSCSPQRR